MPAVFNRPNRLGAIHQLKRRRLVADQHTLPMTPVALIWPADCADRPGNIDRAWDSFEPTNRSIEDVFKTCVLNDNFMCSFTLHKTKLNAHCSLLSAAVSCLAP